MFCVKCGQEIGEAKFCQYCGYPATATPVQNNVPSSEYAYKPLLVRLQEFDYGKLISIVSVVLAAIGMFIRYGNNEIETVRYGLAFDDYYVISEEGRSKIVTVIMIHIILTGILIYLGMNSKKKVSVFPILLAVVALGVLIAAMTMRFGAPY